MSPDRFAPSNAKTERETALLASKIEYTSLKKDLKDEEVLGLCKEAVQLKVFGVCIPLGYVPYVKEVLRKAPQKIITVVDFPLGNASPERKVEEAIMAEGIGADEIDMVMDYQALLHLDYERVFRGISEVVQAVSPAPVKVIVETSALNEAQLAIACCLVQLGGAAFIKTSTGFHKAGAEEKDIKLMRELLDPRIQIKASGGIRSRGQALALIKAGADRIGTSRAADILRPLHLIT